MGVIEGVYMVGVGSGEGGWVLRCQSGRHSIRMLDRILFPPSGGMKGGDVSPDAGCFGGDRVGCGRGSKIPDIRGFCTKI